MRRKLMVFFSTLVLSILCVFGATSCGNILNISCDDDKHEYSAAWTIEKQATCTEEGLQTRKCDFCPHIEEKVIAKVAHKYETIAEKKATCDTDGHSKYKKCKVCKQEVGKTVYKKLGHDEKHKDSKVANCKQRAYCGVCKKSYGSTENHVYTEVKMEAKEATCTEVGNGEYVYCSVGGCTYTTIKVIPALGHDGFREGQIDLPLSKVKLISVASHIENCDEEAYCGICHATYTPMAHTSYDGKETKDKNKVATCTEPAYCGRCEQSYGLSKGHDWEEYKKTMPTCKESGYEAYKKCKRCSVYEPEKIVISPHGHYRVDIQVEATCEGYGVDVKNICLHCEIDDLKLAIAHRQQYATKKAHEKVCENKACREYFNSNTAIIAPLGHDSERKGYEDLTGVAKEITIPPCANSGKGFCSVCMKEYDGKAEHTFTTTIKKVTADCTKFGIDITGFNEKQGTKLCTFCQKDDYEFALAHRQEYVEKYGDKYQEEHDKVCKDEACKTYWTYITNPLGHDIERENYTLSTAEKKYSIAPTCENNGHGRCGICKQYYDVPVHKFEYGECILCGKEEPIE